MTTKEYLSRGRYIENEIAVLLKSKENAFAQVTNCAALTSETSLDKSSQSNTMEARYIKYLTEVARLEKTIDSYIDQLYCIKEEALTAINTVEDANLRTLLIHRYINCKTFEQIAVEMNYSYRQVLRMHGEALQKVKMS